MKCDRCGKEIPNTDLYCGRCGKAVFPEYMDEDDIWAYYKTDEELEEILRAEQGEEEYQPAKLVRITRVPKEKEKIKEEPEVLQGEKEPEEIIPEKSEEETEAPEETEEISEASVIEPEPETEPEIKEEPEELTNEPESIEEPVQEIVSKEPLEEENVWEEDLFDEEDDEDEKPHLSPQKKKKRRKIAFFITFILLVCAGIGLALGMKRMRDLDSQEKEYYEKLHKEVVHQDNSSSETQKEVDETSVKDESQQKETSNQEDFQFVNSDEIDFSQYQKVIAVSTEQNSIKESDAYDYSAKSVVDGDITTSWQENEEGTGETTGIQINFDGNHKVRYLVLYLGNWSGDQLWKYSARPKTMTIRVGDSWSQDVEFSDEKKKFCISFDEPIDASYLSMHIASSYEGSRWDDNGISEVEIYE